MGTIGASEQAQQRLLWPRLFAAHGHGKAAAYGGCRDVSSASQVWHAHVYTDHAWVIPCVSCLNHARPSLKIHAPPGTILEKLMRNVMTFLRESWLICTLLKESSEKDRKLHLSMYGKAAQLEKQMDAKSAWFQEKYSGRTHGGIGCSSSQANCPLTEKELHQLRMDEEAQKGMLEEEAMNKKAQEDKIRQEQAENDAFFLEFGVVRYDSEYESQIND
ncbi:hypothetical protein Tco_0912294 [Tanacetum coccineum]